MSPGVVSILIFKSQITLHAKQGTIKLAFFTVFLKKREFLQMTPNIGILNTIGNYFSPRVWIRDRYLKIMLRLAQINSQNFVILHGNT